MTFNVQDLTAPSLLPEKLVLTRERSHLAPVGLKALGLLGVRAESLELGPSRHDRFGHRKRARKRSFITMGRGFTSPLRVTERSAGLFLHLLLGLLQ